MTRLPLAARWSMFAAILFARNPSALLHAAFWAEDGAVWYADAYRDGWACLWLPHSGYLQVAPRLVALLAQMLPLIWAPTIFAVSALTIQALAPALLLSPRLEHAWPDRVACVVLALACVLLPNATEVMMNLTNAQWHLAFATFITVVLRPAEGRLHGYGELALLALAGLSGPFCLFLAPIALWQFAEARSGVALRKLAVLAACAGVQAAMLLATLETTRSHAPAGASLTALARMLALQIFAGGLLGAHLVARIHGSAIWRSDALPMAVALLGVALIALAFARGSSLLRKCLAGAVLLLAAALTNPQVSMVEPQWDVLTRPGAGNRYFFIPIVVWIAVCLSLAGDRITAVRRSARLLLLLLPVGIAADFRLPHLAPTDFDEKARTFANAPVGARASFEVNPRGFPPMVLIKRALIDDPE